MTETKVKYFTTPDGPADTWFADRIAAAYAAKDTMMADVPDDYPDTTAVDKLVIEAALGVADDPLAQFAESDCWACQLARGDLSQHKSRWFYIGDYGAVVEDLNPKGSALRLLCVPKEHVSVGQESVHMRNIAKSLLAGIARALAIESDMQMGRLDLGEHSYDRHWHAQICLEWK